MYLFTSRLVCLSDVWCCSVVYSVLVDAATAPRSIGGMPNEGTMNAAVKQVILAVAEEAADSVLWWKFWRPRFPKPLEDKKKVRQIKSPKKVVLGILYHSSRKGIVQNEKKKTYIHKDKVQPPQLIFPDEQKSLWGFCNIFQKTFLNLPKTLPTLWAIL